MTEQPSFAKRLEDLKADVHTEVRAIFQTITDAQRRAADVLPILRAFDMEVPPGIDAAATFNDWVLMRTAPPIPAPEPVAIDRPFGGTVEPAATTPQSAPPASDGPTPADPPPAPSATGGGRKTPVSAGPVTMERVARARELTADWGIFTGARLGAALRPEKPIDGQTLFSVTAPLLDDGTLRKERVKVAGRGGRTIWVHKDYDGPITDEAVRARESADAPAPAEAAALALTEAAVRDWGKEHSPFTIPAMARGLGVRQQDILPYVRAWINRGVFAEHEEDGRRSYEYQPPDPAPVNRPRQPPPEVQLKGTNPARGGSVHGGVAGTGDTGLPRHLRLIKGHLKDGVEIVRLGGGRGHFGFRNGGGELIRGSGTSQPLTTSSTPQNADEEAKQTMRRLRDVGALKPGA